MSVPLVWVTWIALIIKANSASQSLDTQLGGTKLEQYHKFCDNLDENLENFVNPSTDISELTCEFDKKDAWTDS